MQFMHNFKLTHAYVGRGDGQHLCRNLIPSGLRWPMQLSSDTAAPGVPAGLPTYGAPPLSNDLEPDKVQELINLSESGLRLEPRPTGRESPASQGAWRAERVGSNCQRG